MWKLNFDWQVHGKILALMYTDYISSFLDQFDEIEWKRIENTVLYRQWMPNEAVCMGAIGISFLFLSRLLSYIVWLIRGSRWTHQQQKKQQQKQHQQQTSISKLGRPLPPRSLSVCLSLFLFCFSLEKFHRWKWLKNERLTWYWFIIHVPKE